MKNLLAAIIGTSFLSCFWVANVRAEIATLEIDGKNPNQEKTLQSQGVEATLTYQKQISEYGDIDEIPILTVSGGGSTIQAIGYVSSFPYSLVQIAEMDPNNYLPEVLFSSFTGGAHCCDAVQILTYSPQSSSWEIVHMGFFDGALNGVSDPDQSGVYKYVTNDNRFLYKYSSYASSFPPIQVWQLDGLEMRDVSMDPRFFPLHRERLQAMWESIESATQTGGEINGVLAGYVATKAILGEAIPAWELMLQRYEKNNEWDFDECFGEYDDQGKCIGEWVSYDSFPAALRGFLVQTNYLSVDNLSSSN